MFLFFVLGGPMVQSVWGGAHSPRNQLRSAREGDPPAQHTSPGSAEEVKVDLGLRDKGGGFFGEAWPRISLSG